MAYPIMVLSAWTFVMKSVDGVETLKLLPGRRLGRAVGCKLFADKCFNNPASADVEVPRSRSRLYAVVHDEGVYA